MAGEKKPDICAHVLPHARRISQEFRSLASTMIINRMGSGREVILNHKMESWRRKGALEKLGVVGIILKPEVKRFLGGFCAGQQVTLRVTQNHPRAAAIAFQVATA